MEKSPEFYVSPHHYNVRVGAHLTAGSTHPLVDAKVTEGFPGETLFTLKGQPDRVKALAHFLRRALDDIEEEVDKLVERVS